MKVLLLSMPDSFEHMQSLTTRMPNGALSSLAGNLDSRHTVAVADLILVQRRVRETVEDLMTRFDPDVVGLSVMTFQRKTAKKIIQLVRARKPAVHVVAGGYDPSLAPEAYVENGGTGVDFIVRGEGEVTFRELITAIEQGSGYAGIAGLSYRDDDTFRRNPPRAMSRLDDIQLPNRTSRVLTGYTLNGRQIDVVETSRGCTFDCSFCSIIEMRGRNFYIYPIERVLADIRDARDKGARAIFIVDDNITLDVKRFETLCRAIIDARLNNIDYTVQAMTSAIANHGDTLAPLMRRAGFRYVFLGIENVLEDDLQFLHADAKNILRKNGHRVGNAAVTAIEYLHRNKMYVVGGLIVGNPTDTRESVAANLEFAGKYIDWPYIQHPTPYPRTRMTQELYDRGLVLHDRVEEYDGTTSIIRTENLPAEEIEFLRWKAERWFKFRVWPLMFKHDPLFVLRYGVEMIRLIYRGATLKTFLGLEDERKAFERYRALRHAERNYL
jgi:anaerobic magnesium-protoporphyrin IX monomethyl ester cyclase